MISKITNFLRIFFHRKKNS